MRRSLENAKAHLPEGYVIVSDHFIGTARDLIDGPPGPMVSQQEAESWDEVIRLDLAEQLALMPRKKSK